MNLVNTSQLVRGHPHFHTIFNARRQLTFKQLVAHHISAANLNKIDISTLLNMYLLSPSD